MSVIIKDGRFYTGIPWIELTGTLTAGSTSITFNDGSITTNSTIEVFSNVFGVEATNIVITMGQAVVTFAAQNSDISVKVRIT